MSRGGPVRDKRVDRYRLANGLKVLLLRDTSAPVASYHTWFGVGSRHEQPGKTGLAHLFEHLMFNETEDLAPGEFDRTLEAAGGEVNAATWVDWTFYYENVPSSELPLVIRLEAERMKKLVLREPQVQSEKEVVANERRYRVDDDVEGAVNELLYKTAFTKHPYHWPTIGWMEDIEGFTTEDCEAFYSTYYAPNNAAIVVVGDFDEGDALAADPGPLRRARPPPRCPRAELTRRARADRASACSSSRSRRPPRSSRSATTRPRSASRSHAPLTVLNEILFGGRARACIARWSARASSPARCAARVAPFRDPGLYEIWVSLREGKTAQRGAGRGRARARRGCARSR